MTNGTARYSNRVVMPRFWRMLVIALCTLILCSCRGGIHTGQCPPADCPTMPGQTYGMQGFPPLTAGASGPWAPPGLSQPWPPNEYLADGGDYGYTATVKPDWEVRGLEPADTIAHFDTLEGETLVQPSNRVHIYSPRFGAVRQVVSLVRNDQVDRFSSVAQPIYLVQEDDFQAAVSSKQQEQLERYTAGRLPSEYLSQQGDGAISAKLGPLGFQSAFQPYENCSAIREGVMVEAEMAWLAKGATAAIAWTQTESVEVILDHQRAAVEVGDQSLASVYRVEEPPGKPKLRILKVASTQAALPGDFVDFTLRFDNLGNEAIGNVTIMDNLTTRLEYVADSAQCSIPAKFVTEENEAGSLVLRWEIDDPLQRNEGGIIRFRCRVR